jgi:hypothetical protein
VSRYRPGILYVGFLAFLIGLGAALEVGGAEAWWLMGLGAVLWAFGSALDD